MEAVVSCWSPATLWANDDVFTLEQLRQVNLHFFIRYHELEWNNYLVCRYFLILDHAPNSVLKRCELLIIHANLGCLLDCHLEDLVIAVCQLSVLD